MAEKIQLSKIRLDGGTQSRCNMHPDVTEDYLAAMQNGAQFPPVVVFYDGETYWLADGYHRYFATHRKAALTGDYDTSIECEVIQGTQRDAVLYSVGANATHGLRRSNADKRRAITFMLRDEEWSKWSDREIARRCGVSQPTVSTLRRELSDKNFQIEQPDKVTVNRNGSSYTMRRPAPKHWAERRDLQNLFWGQVNRNGLDQATILEKLQPGANVLTDLAASIEEIEKLLNRIAIEEHSAAWKRGDYVRFKTEIGVRYGQVVTCAPDYMIVLSLSTGMEQAWKYQYCQPATREEWEASVSQQSEAQPPAPTPEPEPAPEQAEENCFIPDLPRRQVEFILALHTGEPVVKNAATRLALRGHGLITQDDDWDAIRLTPCGQQAAAAYDLVPIEEVDELRAGPEPEIDYTRLSLADYQADDLVEIMPALARVLAYCEGYDVPADDDLAAAAWQVFRFFDQVTEMVAEDSPREAI